METIKTVLIVILIFAAGYFAWIDQHRVQRMDQLNTNDQIQTQANEDFQLALHDLEMKFIGRGKHIQEFQKALEVLNDSLQQKERHLKNKIQSVEAMLVDYQRNNDNRVQNIKDDLEKTVSDIGSLERRLNRRIADIETNYRLLKSDVETNTKDIKVLREPKEEEKKRR